MEIKISSDLPTGRGEEGDASPGSERRLLLMCLPLLPSGLNAGAFYALSTLLNRMVVLHFPVRRGDTKSFRLSLKRLGRGSLLALVLGSL